MNKTNKNTLLLAVFASLVTFAQNEEPFDDLDFELDTPSENAPQSEVDEGVREVLESKNPQPDELEDLEKDLEIAVPKPLVPPALVSDGDPGLGLEPPEQFERIPLRPQMSTKSWEKWAGPAVEKLYKIRRGDTLWGISEKMFGNPYLWPKVWQLNATFGNPHIVDPGAELEFRPGNPNSAPELALRTDSGEAQLTPLLFTPARLNFLESLEKILSYQEQSGEPLYKFFLLSSLPEEIERLPPKEIGTGFFYSEGQKFRLEDVNDGQYSVVRVVAPAQSSQTIRKTSYGAYRLRVVGRLEVVGGDARVVAGYAELNPGDIITQESYKVSSLSLREVSLGEAGRDIKIVALEEGGIAVPAQNKAVGLRFNDDEQAPAGSILTFVDRDSRETARGLVVYRQGRFGTILLIESKRELFVTDRVL